MSNSGNSIKHDAIREVPVGAGITTSYQSLGSVLTRDSFRIWVTNNTNGDIYLTTDTTVDQMKLPAGTGRAYDNKTNDMFIKAGTQFSLKWLSAPAVPSGWFAVEVEYV